MRYLLALGACVALVAPEVAFAQAAPSTAPGAVTICIFSKEEVLTTSVVGKYVLNRIEQIEDQTEAKLRSDMTALQNDRSALDASTTLNSVARSAQESELEKRDRNLHDESDFLQREVKATLERAETRFEGEMTPLVGQVYAQRNCSVLFDRSAVYGDHMDMNLDISPDVIRLLNAKITQFPVNLAP